MKIKNQKELAVTPLRKDALNIIEAGLEAIDTTEVINKSVSIDDSRLKVNGENIPLEGIRRIFVVGIGKCAFEGGEALEKILGERLTGGITLDIQKGTLHKIKSFIGTHPLMSEINIDVTKEIINLLTGMTENDLVIFIISGGGSALLCQPNNFTCQDETMIVNHLMDSGVPIREMNTVRKHLSLARGGYLAQYAYPARIVSLIFSDVPGNDPEFIASGPTVPDTTTISDAEKILEKYNIWKKYATTPITLIETPKDPKIFKNVRNILIDSNIVALKAMEGKAESLGYKAKIMEENFSGEAREVAKKILKDLNKKYEKSVLLYGGESTVTMRGKGQGGRNQELALSALAGMKSGQLITSVATDGHDNSDHAGAIADEETKRHAQDSGLGAEDYLNDNDSYNFFKKTGDFLSTGNTGSNVSDIIIAICE